MGIDLILFTVRSQLAWHFHANLLGICGSLGVRWSKYQDAFGVIGLFGAVVFYSMLPIVA